MLDAEGRIEDIRRAISNRPFFNLFEAFETLDRNEDGFITVDEFKMFLEENNITFTVADVKNLVKRYDTDHDGKVSYKEFIKELTPKSPFKKGSE